MKSIIAVLVLSATLVGCNSTQKAAGTGAGVGAAVGLLTTGNARGAVVGALIGAAAGTLIERVANERNMCWYADGNGGKYKARC